MSQRLTEPTAEGTPLPPRDRIAGVDVARALAVFGMFTAHLGVGSIGLLDGDPADTLYELTRGRSSALFAFLAGVSLALVTGRTRPVSGTPLRRASARILVRALALALLGGLLDLLGAPVAIILTYYGGFFVLALPLLRLRAPALALTAVAAALIGPQLSFVVRAAMGEGQPVRESSIGGVTDFLLTGYYPACSFMAFVVAGMAVGRLDLRSGRVRLGMAGTGAALALAGYGGSWVLMRPLGGLDRVTEAALGWQGVDLGAAESEYRRSLREWLLAEINDLHGTVPVGSPWWLAVSSPHSGTTFEIVGATGVALLVLAGCLVAAEAARPVCYPLAAAGAMALTVYAGHIVVLAVIGASPDDVAPFRLELFVLGALLLATVWRPVLGRGPLEAGTARLADTGARLVPDPTPDPHRRP